MLGNTLKTVGEKVPKFSTKIWTEAHDQLANAIDRYKTSN